MTAGDFFVVRTPGLPARVIRAVTRSGYNHAGVVVDKIGTTVEAQPFGAAYGNLENYAGLPMLVGSPVPLSAADRRAIAYRARLLVGIPYGWLDVLDLGLLQFGVSWPALRRRVARRSSLVCSELVDLSYTLAGVHLFTDGRPPEDVTPGDLALLLDPHSPKGPPVKLPKLSPRMKALVVHDALLFASAFAATGIVASNHLTLDAFAAALVTAAKVVVRSLVPVPAKP